MFRFIIAAMWTTIFLLLSIPVIIIEFFIGLISPKTRAKHSQAIICGTFKVLKAIAGTKLTIKGLSNVPTDEPVLYVPNHRSIFDIILTYPLCPRTTAYVAKKETKKVPIFSIWMAFMNCQFLDRKDLRKGLKIILKCVDLVKGGSSVCIFPEGTRNKTEETLLPFHDGSLKIAEKTGCKIIPVAICNSEKIFEAQFPKIRKTNVVIEYCKPVDPSDFSKENKRDISLMVQDEIKTAYEKNKSLV